MKPALLTDAAVQHLEICPVEAIMVVSSLSPRAYPSQCRSYG